ncbi:MAG: PstA family ABC transporter permease [Thermodesulfobacteriota bacterium]
MAMRRLVELTLPFFSWLCGIILLCAVLVVIGYLLVRGWGSLRLSLVFGSTPPLDALLMNRHVLDGLFPAMAGTFFLVILSVCWAIPVGVAAGIYLAEYAGPAGRAVINLFFDIMAGLPSIVVGLFGFSVAVFLNKKFPGRIQPCLLISSLSLAVLVLPYLVRATQASLEGLPAAIRMTALSLGASRLQNILHVLLPRAFPSIFSGVILAIGRCAEDTAVIMLTGAVASAGMPRSLLSHYEALPFYIYYISSQYADQQELATGYGAALLLLLVCLFLFLLAVAVRKRVVWQAFARI